MQYYFQSLIQSEQPHWIKFFVYFISKNLFFLFYTSTFTKYLHQFIYFTHLFNKIFILLHFYYFLTHGLSLSLSLSLSLKPNHYHHHPTTIKLKPRSFRPKLCDFFVPHSHGWSESKPRPIQVETQGWLKRRLIRPIEVESEWGVREKEKKKAETRERKTETNRDKWEKKINKIIINELQ